MSTAALAEARAQRMRDEADLITLRARLGAGFRYPDGSSGDVIADGGLVRAKVALLSGPGSYWVLVFADAGLAEGKTLVPLTAVRITAD